MLNGLVLALLVGCASTNIVDAPKPMKSAFNFQACLRQEGWNIYLITNGLYYLNSPPFGLTVCKTNEGHAVDFISKEKFFKQFTNINWLEVIHRGKPDHIERDIIDGTIHQDGWRDPDAQ